VSENEFEPLYVHTIQWSPQGSVNKMTLLIGPSGSITQPPLILSNCACTWVELGKQFTLYARCETMVEAQIWGCGWTCAWQIVNPRNQCGNISKSIQSVTLEKAYIWGNFGENKCVAFHLGFLEPCKMKSLTAKLNHNVV